MQCSVNEVTLTVSGVTKTYMQHIHTCIHMQHSIFIIPSDMIVLQYHQNTHSSELCFLQVSGVFICVFVICVTKPVIGVTCNWLHQ